MDGHGCPCAEGYVCCEELNVCREEMEGCGPAATSDGGLPPTGDGGPQAVRDGSSDDLGPFGPVQSWTGYIESYKFPSGSNAVKLTFATTATGEVSGAVVFGNAAPPPPATDPSVGYPPGQSSSAFGDSPSIYLAEGFAYPIESGTLTGGRLQLHVDRGSLWSDWCALQKEQEGSGRCLPNWGGGTSENGDGTCFMESDQHVRITVDCGKHLLCWREPVCTCDPSGCRARQNVGHMSFDIALAGTTANGSVDGLPVVLRNIHLTRDP